MVLDPDQTGALGRKPARYRLLLDLLLALTVALTVRAALAAALTRLRLAGRRSSRSTPALWADRMGGMREIVFDSRVFLEGSTYVAHCPELDVSSCGDSIEKARRMLRSAVRLFLEESEKLGTLDVILKEAGYRPRRVNGSVCWEPPALVATERMALEV